MDDGYFYQRKIGDKIYTKIMLGNVKDILKDIGKENEENLENNIDKELVAQLKKLARHYGEEDMKRNG